MIFWDTYIFLKLSFSLSRNVIDFSQIWKRCIFEYHRSTCNARRRGVVVRGRRSGKYFGAWTALRKISLAIGGTLTLKAFQQIMSYSLGWPSIWPKLPTNVGFGTKNVQKFSRGNTPSHTQHGYTLFTGAQSNCSPKSKFTTTPLLRSRSLNLLHDFQLWKAVLFVVCCVPYVCHFVPVFNMYLLQMLCC